MTCFCCNQKGHYANLCPFKEIIKQEQTKRDQLGFLANLVPQNVINVAATKNDADASGTKELTIRPRGKDQIEITVPTTDEYELQQIKNAITTAGQLEFRVVANTRDHSDIIGLARAQASLTEDKDRTKADVRDATGRVVGRWYAVGRAKEEVEGINSFDNFILHFLSIFLIILINALSFKLKNVLIS